MPINDSKSLEALDRESLHAIGQELKKHFPPRHGGTELVLMEVSPQRLHAYWHVTPADLKGALAKAKDPQARLVIRFYDLSKPATGRTSRQWFDVELTETSGSRYVELWQAAKRYAGELGLRTERDKLLSLAHSNTVELPRGDQSPRAGSRVLTLTPGAERLYHPPIDINHGTEVSFYQSWRENPDQPADLTLLDSGVDLYPEFPNPLHESGRERQLNLPSYQRLQAIEISPPTRQAQLSGRLPDPTLTDASPTEAASQVLGREFPLSPIEALDWDHTSDLPMGILTWPSSPLPPWPDELPIPHPGESLAMSLATSPSSFPGSPPQPLSSFELGSEVQTEPAMELHMELHIHGHKPPDGPFILFDQPIPTDEQGNFSLTRVLPLETQQLVAQLLAASRDH
jgi:hypothetical protein